MFLAKVEGSVVSTKKDASMGGRKLLILRPQLVDEKDPTKFRPGLNTIVAVDSVGAGIGEMVMFCQGSSARLARTEGCAGRCRDHRHRRCRGCPETDLQRKAVTSSPTRMTGLQHYYEAPGGNACRVLFIGAKCWAALKRAAQRSSGGCRSRDALLLEWPFYGADSSEGPIGSSRQ